MPTAYVTAPREVAADLAATLVEERLAACVNRFDCRSTFRWDGDVVREKEAALLIKTTDDRYGELKRRIEELHPHEVPCIERFDEADALESFAGWVADSVE
ncbi:MAG: periplasmic divalent cation tolerance protein [Natronomonas sp.]|jgi:periplasmic divalent cation tolerance protein|uniref:divalent-cation tolerance protein CutA n=1 Tax=Natronomonas sp. TaxID=2184060 RepID=UPI003989DE58